ncbi:Endonuclease domain-containing 1 protein [Nibea albiflora]|uniref:Endonuclease domain-containing 1 protein n=1 Tax=Nibea albiflora TaxID=240163 RepID=A0ACB7EW64_NIBAL|nr:Endonuclease domain-containing 1 protein [Nibea albiflora]
MSKFRKRCQFFSTVVLRLNDIVGKQLRCSNILPGTCPENSLIFREALMLGLPHHLVLSNVQHRIKIQGNNYVDMKELVSDLFTPKDMKNQEVPMETNQLEDVLMMNTPVVKKALRLGVPPHLIKPKETPPNIPGVLVNGNIQNQNRYKVICQTYGSTKNNPSGRWYLTVYDTVNRIPVFSAYKFSGKKAGGRASDGWKIEPQLEDGADQNDKYMKPEEQGKSYNRQAMNADYESIKAEYNRGHLLPVSYTVNDPEKISTFTLTNAVPQVISFNGNSWGHMEQCMYYIMFYYINERQMNCFVVVGAKPSAQASSRASSVGSRRASSVGSSRASAGGSRRASSVDSPRASVQSRVNIPSVMWSAFYCNNAQSSIAAAHWGKNEKVNSKTLLVMQTLENLRNIQGIDAFPGTTPTAFDINDINNKKVKQNVNNKCRFQ